MPGSHSAYCDSRFSVNSRNFSRAETRLPCRSSSARTSCHSRSSVWVNRNSGTVALLATQILGYSVLLLDRVTAVDGDDVAGVKRHGRIGEVRRDRGVVPGYAPTPRGSAARDHIGKALV